MPEYIYSFDRLKEALMARMTDEEAAALDEKWTKNPPKVGPNGTGFFAMRKTAQRQAARMVTIDGLSADYLLTKAIAAHKTPADIISDMIQREMVSVGQ
jgi:hypothetical protein